MNDVFSLLNPDWWMDENNNALQITDALLFLLLSIPVVYLFVCALFSLAKYKNPYPETKIKHRFLVLFNVFRNGQEVIQSINHFLDTQQYPSDKYAVAIAASQLSEQDIVTLLTMPVNIVVPDKEECTKVYAIQQVMERYAPDEYDMVILFNSDNRIVPTALDLFNNAYYAGCDAIQAHPMTENLTTSIAILNATSEEINNNIFRKGHTRMGFSSALIGSAMAFDFNTFHRICPTLEGQDLSKAIEAAFLKENIYIEYLEEVVCYSKKVESANSYEKERIGWVNTQKSTTFYALKNLPIAVLKGEWDYVNKMFQWILPSRLLLLAYLAIFTIVITTLDWQLSFKWYGLIFMTVLAFLMALPEGEISKQFRHAFWSLPILVFASGFSHIKNIFPKNKDAKEKVAKGKKRNRKEKLKSNHENSH